ncbi:MAG TPA: beta-galactosidase [Bacteroidales bacterium]|nr:beta-galactosidase [Bacteroidales bacterium]
MTVKTESISLRILITLLISVLCFSTVTPQSKPVVNKSDFFPFSVWYSGGKARATMLSEITPASREEWKKDIQQIKSLGFNSVKTWVEWSHCEPARGKYNFENLRILFELAQEAGLKVIIQVYGESAPDWVGKSFPDGLFEAMNGDKIQPQVAPGYCIDHAGVRDAFLEFYEETSKIAVSYPNFYGWDLWSEPHIVQWGEPGWIPNPQYCFCPNTQERFREWLKGKYSSLEELNKSWYRNFESWEDVSAPRFGTILTYSDFMDWKAFIYQKLAEDLKLRYNAVRKYDKTHVVTAHASPVSLFGSPYGGESGDDFLMADQVDYYGLSQYPKHNLPGDWRPWSFMAQADFSYSANKKNGGYYIGEFQAGFGTVGLNVGDPVTPKDHQIWTWSSLATGAKGIFAYAYYPMSSGYESGGYGLVNLDGTVTERAVELGKVARFVDDNRDLFTASRPVKAQVALVYNPLSQMVGGHRRTTSQDGHINSLIGYYRFLTDQNIAVDFIHRRDVESADLSQYKLIIIPYALMITQKMADGIRNYVEKGGYAFSEARLAWNDNRGFTDGVIPGLGLSRVFGVRESKVRTLKNVYLRVEENNHPAMAGLNEGDTLTGTQFAESVELLENISAKVLAYLDDGTPGIVTSDYGKGHTMYVGSFLAMTNSRGSQWDQSTQRITVQDSSYRNTNKFLNGLTEWAKVESPFISSQQEASSNPLIVRLHEYSGGYLLFILNHGKTTEKTTIKLKVPEQGIYELVEMLSNRRSRTADKGKVIEFGTGEIGVKGAEIWNIKRTGK